MYSPRTPKYGILGPLLLPPPPPPPPPEMVKIRAFFHFVKNTRNTDRIRRNYCIEYHPRGNGQNTAGNTTGIHQNTNKNTRLTEYHLVVQNTTKNTSENTAQNT